jgi:hypothetical protein
MAKVWLREGEVVPLGENTTTTVVSVDFAKYVIACYISFEDNADCFLGPYSRSEVETIRPQLACHNTVHRLTTHLPEWVRFE